MNSNTTIYSTGVLAIIIVIGLVSEVGDTIASTGHDEARKLKELGEILPLEQIINKARQQYTGRILEVELEREDGRYIYELELLDDKGTVWELEFDAKSGELIKKRKDD